MMTFGFSSLLIGKVADKMFNSDFGWSKTYLLLGAIIGAVILVTGLIIRAPKPEEIAEFVKSKKAVSETEDFTASQMLGKSSFWKMFIFFVLFSAVGGIALSFGKDILLSVSMSKETAVTIASLLAIFNGIGRLVSGALFDTIGTRKTQFATSGVVIAASGLTLIGILANSPVISAAGICLCAFSYGFSPTVSAALCGEFYGLKNFSLNFSILNLVLIPSAFYATIAGKIVDTTGGFAIVFVILTAFSVVGLIDNIFIKKN